jgi:hypothetical protein
MHMKANGGAPLKWRDRPPCRHEAPAPRGFRDGSQLGWLEQRGVETEPALKARRARGRRHSTVSRSTLSSILRVGVAEGEA